MNRPPANGLGFFGGLQQGLNGRSLLLSLLAGAVLTLLFSQLRGLSWPAAAVLLPGLSLAIAAPHALLHGYFGWRLGRGCRAERRGDRALARRHLQPLARSWVAHYDPQGQARAAWQRVGRSQQ